MSLFDLSSRKTKLRKINNQDVTPTQEYIYIHTHMLETLHVVSEIAATDSAVSPVRTGQATYV